MSSTSGAAPWTLMGSIRETAPIGSRTRALAPSKVQCTCVRRFAYLFFLGTLS